MPGIAAGIQARTSDLSIELLRSDAHTDLIRQNVDVTVRSSRNMGDDLVATQAGLLAYAVYAKPDSHDGWLGLIGSPERSEPAKWIVEDVNPRSINATSDSFITMRHLAAHGLDRAILPRFLGDADPRLRLISEKMPTFAVPLWVASHAEIANTPRLRSIRLELVEGLHELAQELSGSE